jgi:hypothetical protein
VGRFARDKGRRGEQEFCTEARGALGDLGTFERNSLQSRMGGKDILTNLPWAVEVKRGEKPLLNQWVAQASEQAAPNEVPVVAWRPNKRGWLMVIPVSFATWCHIVRAVHWYHKSGRYLEDAKAGKLIGQREQAVKALENLKRTIVASPSINAPEFLRSARNSGEFSVDE